MDRASLLRALFDAAVAAADPMRCIPAALPPKPEGRVFVIGAGKASARMAEALEAHWGPCDGFVITRYGYGRVTKRIKIVEAAHPVPDAAGAAATLQMLDLVEPLGAADTVVALISGGGSSLLVSPAGKVTLAEKQALNAALLASGAPIDRMNVVRKHLSRVKGGQLAAAVAPARLLTLMISDVPGDNPAFIASGPSVGDPSTPQDALAILKKYKITPPPSVLEALSKPSGVLAPDDPRLAKAENHVIAAPAQSLEAAAKIARATGITVRILGDAIEGEARDTGTYLAREALAAQQPLHRGDPPVLLLSGGECTVSGRGRGIGGPNAECALACAIELKGQPGIHGIFCDTDGVDGAAEVAGARISPQTLARAAEARVDPHMALAAHDSHSFFDQIGDQIVTGPTLTNVNDFRAVFVAPRSGA